MVLLPNTSSTTYKEVLKLKEDKAELKAQLDTVLVDNRAMKRVILSLFAKQYEIDDLNDLNDLTVESEYIEGKTEKEVKEINERENSVIQYILKIKKELE